MKTLRILGLVMGVVVTLFDTTFDSRCFAGDPSVLIPKSSNARRIRQQENVQKVYDVLKETSVQEKIDLTDTDRAFFENLIAALDRRTLTKAEETKVSEYLGKIDEYLKYSIRAYEGDEDHQGEVLYCSATTASDKIITFGSAQKYGKRVEKGKPTVTFENYSVQNCDTESLQISTRVQIVSREPNPDTVRRGPAVDSASKSDEASVAK